MKKVIGMIFGIGLLTFARPADAYDISNEKTDAIMAYTAAWFVDHDNHCPRYRVRLFDVLDDLAKAGFTEKDMDALEGIKAAKYLVLESRYQDNPSQICLSLWNYYGPHGTYRRQLLEEK